MSDPSLWQKSNDEYLSMALEWLRLRLERLSEVQAASSSTPSTKTQDKLDEPSWMDRLMGKIYAKDQPESVLSSPSQPVEDEKLSDAALGMKNAEEMPQPPALALLGQRFGLSRFEREVLLLCAATELDTRIASLLARVQGDPSRSYPTFALAFALFDDPAWDVLSPERQLRYWKMLEIDQSYGQPLISCPLHLDQRIMDYIKGLNYLDGRLSPLLSSLDIATEEAQLPASQQAVVDRIVDLQKQFSGTQHQPVIQLLGPDTYSKQLIAWQASLHLGLHLYRMPAELLPIQASELDDLARLWERERVLLPISLYLDVNEVEAGPEGHAPPLGRFMARSHGIIFLDTRDVWPGLAQANAFDVAKPTPMEQEAAWSEALGPEAGESPGLLAGQFNLDLAMIEQIAKSVLTEKNIKRSLHERLWESCLINTRPQLDILAQRLNPKATWDDIVLTKTEIDLLRQIAAQVRNRRAVYDQGGFRKRMNRGLGIGVLFSGESGTGKTMAAEVIANELHMDLYRIDLSQVVSKFIGETEKNLRKLFDAAEDGGAILFFDEADSLFGKRSEVKDSHDRYANIEINYLLQRMESFRGLAILATNMKSALDPAFVRRLRFILDFPYPGPEERKSMWQKVFPPETVTVGLDYDRLARLNLTGGSIHNIALNAAFLAAAARTQVTMQLVLDAARAEFRKSEKPVIEGDFKA